MDQQGTKSGKEYRGQEVLSHFFSSQHDLNITVSAVSMSLGSTSSNMSNPSVKNSSINSSS